MRKKLLVGGDSFSDQQCLSYQGTDIVTWPVLLAKRLDMDLVCLAQSGAGNEQIYSSIQDYVCKNNPENIGMVMAAWSKAERLDYELNSPHSYKGPGRSWHNTRVSPRGELYHFIRKSIRNFYNLQMLCEAHDLPYKQFQMISLFKDYIAEYHAHAAEETRAACIKYINQSSQFFHIDKGNFIGWPIYDEAGGFVVGDVTVHQKWRKFQKLAHNNPARPLFKNVPEDYIISPEDGHPNKAGHELIMEFIYEDL